MKHYFLLGTIQLKHCSYKFLGANCQILEKHKRDLSCSMTEFVPMFGINHRYFTQQLANKMQVLGLVHEPEL